MDAYAVKTDFHMGGGILQPASLTLRAEQEKPGGVVVHAAATGFSHSNSDLSLMSKPAPECAMTIRSAHTREGAAIIRVEKGTTDMNDNEIHTFENHAQDSRVREIDAMPTMGASNANSAGVSGNNPLVVFSKASHARNAAGDGERYEKSEVAQTRNTFDQGETRAQEVVVSGCLNPGDPLTTRIYGVGGANPTLQNGGTGGTIRQGVLVAPAVSKTLSAEGFDGMPDIHKGNGMPVVAIDMDKCKPSNADHERKGGSGFGVSEDGAAYTVQARAGAKQNAVATILTGHSQANGANVNDTGAAYTVASDGQAVAIGCFNMGGNKASAGTDTSGVSPSIVAQHGTDPHAVAVGFKGGRSAKAGIGDEREVSPTLAHEPSALEPTVAVGFDAYNQAATGSVSKTLGTTCGTNDGASAMVPCDSLPDGYIVRRLTPVECERLQGFPDGWTRIPYRDKPADECPDSPRYKALGNSWATNCAEWILRRILAAYQLGLIPDDPEEFAVPGAEGPGSEEVDEP